MERIRHILLLSLVAGSTFFFNLGGPKLWDEDEPRNAGCAVEMLARGDWVVPYFNGEIRTHKPVLLYWFMMSAYAVFGVDEFAARFWSALLGLGTVLMTYGIGTRLLGRSGALLSGLALSSMLMFVVASRAATPDAALIFFVTASLAVYVWTTPLFGEPIRLRWRKPFFGGSVQTSPCPARSRKPFPQDLPAVVLMYGLMGVACLDKGPIGFLLPSAIIGMFLLIQRLPKEGIEERQKEPVAMRTFKTIGNVIHPLRFLRTCVEMRLGWMIISVLGVALPWYLWVTIRSDVAWTTGFFLEHNFGRAVNAMENHSGGPAYYVIAFLVGTFPWSIFFVPTVVEIVRQVRSPAAADSDLLAATDVEMPRMSSTSVQPHSLIFLSCWVAVIVGLFTLASTKLPSYITPCYPAAALLFGYYLMRLSERQSLRFWPYISFACLAIVGIGIAFAIPAFATEFVPNASPLMSVGVVLAVGAAVAAFSWSKGDATGTIRTAVMTSVAFVMLLFGWGASRVSKHQEFGAIVDKISDESKNPSIAYAGAMRSSWVFYLRTPITPLNAKDEAAVAEFLSQGRDHFIIATDAMAKTIRDREPSLCRIVESVPFFLKPGEELKLIQGASNHNLANPNLADRSDGSSEGRF